MSIETVCAQIIKLSEGDFADAEAEVLMQVNYHHPLKPATTAAVRKLGQHNMKSLRLIKALQNQLQQGAELEVEL